MDHTDDAILVMLRSLVAEGMCLREAIQHSIELVGPDPLYSSMISYFPEEGKSFSIK